MFSLNDITKSKSSLHVILDGMLIMQSISLRFCCGTNDEVDVFSIVDSSKGVKLLKKYKFFNKCWYLKFSRHDQY